MAKHLRRVGFFVEFGFAGANAGSLKAAVQDAAGYDKAAVAGYLRAAPVLAVAPGVLRDVFDPDGSAVMTRSIKTDGAYEWPAPLAFYVQRYNVALPADFLSHIAARAYRVPTREEIGLPGA
ncbi:MAG: hypothetical protein JNK67_00170 [Alphaproteobacteria bacterium]|nr:hypothetical protein [Alphaproteobacteria bacterium]